MSRWAQLGSHKILIFWLKLLVVTLLLHAVVLMPLLVGRKKKVNFNISTTQVFLNYQINVNPFKKTVAKPAASISKTKTPVIKKAELAAAPKVTPKVAPKVALKQQANILETKNIKKIEHKKPAQKIEPKIEPKVEQVKQEIKQEIEQGQPVEIGRKDLEDLKLITLVHNQVAKQFKPPKGMSPDLECIIKISLDNLGKLKDIEIEKSSNILAFDLSAKRAAMQAKMPKEIWGKEIVLNFKV